MLKREIEDGEQSLADPAFRADVLAGLERRPRAIPARWFYDRRGSELFEAITDLPEYYPTRTERSILETACPEVAEIAGAGRAVVEFGSGSSTKTPILLKAVAPSVYVPIDISGDFLRESSRVLADQFPELLVLPFEADFMRPLALPKTIADTPKLGFFPGSTIGNMIPLMAVDLLKAMRASLGIGAMLLIGMDRIKDPAVLVPAYDDAQGVTAAFTIEGRPFDIAAGETIHTENSHKYGSRDARILLRSGGWTPIREWTDPAGLFSLYLAEAQAERPAP